MKESEPKIPRYYSEKDGFLEIEAEETIRLENLIDQNVQKINDAKERILEAENAIVQLKYVLSEYEKLIASKGETEDKIQGMKRVQRTLKEYQKDFDDFIIAAHACEEKNAELQKELDERELLFGHTEGTLH
jgi:hypothetical protein